MADVTSGMNLLINPRKNKAGSSDAMSIASSMADDVRSVRSSRSDARVVPRGLAAIARAAPPRVVAAASVADEETGDEDDDESGRDGDEEDDEEDEQARPMHQHQQAGRRYSGGGGGRDDDSASQYSLPSARGAAAAPLSEEALFNMKKELLYQFDRLERKGVTLPRKFNISSSLEEMRSEYERLRTDREVDASVKFQRKMMLACVTGIEYLNNKFDPFDLQLDGWSDQIHEGITEYDDVFEELYMKYRGKANVAPELRVMFMIGGSGMMFHLTNSMFRPHLPGFDQVMKSNPDLMRQFQQAAVAQQMGGGQQRQQPQQQAAPRGGGGGIFSMLGGLFGGGGGGFAPPPAPAANVSMRGPAHVEDILRDMHGNAFAGGGMQQQQGGNSNTRVEIISNASDSDGEFPDDASINGLLRSTVLQREQEQQQMGVVQQAARRAGAGGRGGAAPRGKARKAAVSRVIDV